VPPPACSGLCQRARRAGRLALRSGAAVEADGVSGHRRAFWRRCCAGLMVIVGLRPSKLSDQCPRQCRQWGCVVRVQLKLQGR